jgi:hypothetical protein
MALGKKVFIQKSVGGQLYKWSPQPNDFSKKSKTNETPYYCNAVAGSQGQDWITTYVYNLEVVNSQQAHFAYVECDYIQ